MLYRVKTREFRDTNRFFLWAKFQNEKVSIFIRYRVRLEWISNRGYSIPMECVLSLMNIFVSASGVESSTICIVLIVVLLWTFLATCSVIMDREIIATRMIKFRIIVTCYSKRDYQSQCLLLAIFDICAFCVVCISDLMSSVIPHYHYAQFSLCHSFRFETMSKPLYQLHCCILRPKRTEKDAQFLYFMKLYKYY